MFAEKEFIELSRKFVCLRLETYESEENQERVRKYLNGKLANTAFVVLSPDGKTQLSRASRSPTMSFSRGQVKNDELQREDVLEAMKKIASKYSAKDAPSKALVPDFSSFKQALNVSSADQRLLVFTVAPVSLREMQREELKKLTGDSELRGKFHYDTASSSDKDWAAVIKNVQASSGHFVIYPGEFGLDGKVVKHFPLEANVAEMRSVLLKLNADYKATEKPKDYSEHLSKARRLGVSYSNTMEYGEDRDGDGKIDSSRNTRRRR
ncbi:hypothetical protein ACFPK9_15580 [Rubritalea spongiae]|uniref:Uncharacterized protein n=1 Tax=Rubritalea spongiae TaxID=430797 RepID=A0ABW5E0I2_9BACT